MINTFLNYYKKYLFTFIIDIFSAFLISAIGIIYPIVMRNLLNIYIPNKQLNNIIICGIILVLANIIHLGMKYFMDYKGHMLGIKMQLDMRKDIFSHLQNLPYNFYDNHSTGELITRTSNDLYSVSELAHHAPELLIGSITSIVFAFVYLATINIKLTLILLNKFAKTTT